MASLTVAEKQHWKDRIARRIDRKIESITANDTHLLERIEEEARNRALRSLGLAEMQAELDGLEKHKEELEAPGIPENAGVGSADPCRGD